MITIGKSSKIVRFNKKLDFLKIFSWLGTIFSIVGAFLVANGFFLIGYLFFGAGAIFLLIMAKMLKNDALMLLEFIFLIANINGVITNL